MNDKTIELLERVATQLGTTSDQIWMILSAQAQVQLYNNIIFSIFWLIAWITATHILFNLYKKPCSEEGSLIFTMILETIMLWGIILIESRDTLTLIINPNYWVMQKLINLTSQLL